MGQLLRLFTKRVFIWGHIGLGLLFLLACANRWIDPSRIWWLSFLALIFPLLLLLVAGYFFFWLLFRSKWALLSVGLLLIGYGQIRALVGMQPNSAESKAHPTSANTLRIMSWNISLFDFEMLRQKKNLPQRKQTFAFIKAQDADIICLQEYIDGHNVPSKFYSNVEDMKKLGYPYHYAVGDRTISMYKYKLGVAIFSRYPIIDTARIRFHTEALQRVPESLIYVDLKLPQDTLRIFTAHLQSNLFDKKDWKNLSRIKNGEDSMLWASYSILQKLKSASSIRAEQARMVHQVVDQSPYRSIISCDLNDVPNSYNYFAIRGDHKDAFVEKGWGIGRTFKNLAPTLRIDYIFSDARFDVLQYFRPTQDFSDHDPVVADLRW